MDRVSFINKIKHLKENFTNENNLINLFLNIINNTENAVYSCEEDVYNIQSLYSNFDCNVVKDFPYSCSIKDTSYMIDVTYRVNNSNSGSINILFKENNAVLYNQHDKSINFVWMGSNKVFDELVIFDNLKVYRKLNENGSKRLIHADLKYISKIKYRYLNYGWGVIKVILSSFSESNILFKDICRELENKGIYLPVTLNEIWESKSKKELIERHCINYIIPNSINKYPLNFGYIYVKSQKYCNKEENQKLISIQDEFMNNLCRDSVVNQIKKMYTLYYNKVSGCKKDDDMLKLIIEDYVDMIWKYKKPRMFNLKIKSINRLTQEHNNISHELRVKSTPKVKVPKDSKFNEVRLPKAFERIKTRRRLINESVIQNNCVWSYADYINKDKCAIYSTIYNNTRYTIEIVKKRKKFEIAQVCGPNNSVAPIELIDDIGNYIEKIN